MRGADSRCGALFSYVGLEARIPKKHPLRAIRHDGYAIGQRIRKRIEEGFGWMKTIGGMRKPKYRGREKVAWAFTLTAAAYNLIRIPKLLAMPT